MHIRYSNLETYSQILFPGKTLPRKFEVEVSAAEMHILIFKEISNFPISTTIKRLYF